MYYFRRSFIIDFWHGPEYTTGISQCLLPLCLCLKNWFCTENHIFFFQASWKDGLSKKIALEYDLSCIIRKDDISFSRKYDLTRYSENERWSFLKNTRKYDIFFRPSENMVFPKGAAPAHDLSCIIWKDGIFFPKTWSFFPGQKVKGGISQEIHGNMMHRPVKKNRNLIYRVEV